MKVWRLLGTTAVCSLMIVAHGRRARAQTGAPLIPIPNRTYVALNPLGIPFDIASFEVESAVATGITIGGVASYTDVNNERYTTFEGKVRFYPGEIVLQGFSVGLTAGSLRYSTPVNGTRETISTPTVGIVTDYNWMLGPLHRFVVGTGVGAKRILASSDERNRVNLDRAYLTARGVIGFAF